MAAAIRKTLPEAAVELKGEEDKPGTFNVALGDTELWSKHETGEFPEVADILSKLPDTPEAAVSQHP